MNITTDKKTVGAHSYELQQKKDEKINPIDLQRAIHKGKKSEDSFENQIHLAVEKGKDLYEGNFFVVVLLKKERLLVNTVRQYFFPRKTCPRPEYDQVVYKYDKKQRSVNFLWVIPDKGSCIRIPLEKHLLPEDQQEFVQFVLDFNSGKLDKLSNKINIQEKNT